MTVKVEQNPHHWNVNTHVSEICLTEIDNIVLMKVETFWIQMATLGFDLSMAFYIVYIHAETTPVCSFKYHDYHYVWKLIEMKPV